jgi:hypothetical protein
VDLDVFVIVLLAELRHSRPAGPEKIGNSDIRIYKASHTQIKTRLGTLFVRRCNAGILFSSIVVERLRSQHLLHFDVDVSR